MTRTDPRRESARPARGAGLASCAEWGLVAMLLENDGALGPAGALAIRALRQRREGGTGKVGAGCGCIRRLGEDGVRGRDLHGLVVRRLVELADAVGRRPDQAVDLVHLPGL